MEEDKDEELEVEKEEGGAEKEGEVLVVVEQEERVSAGEVGEGGGRERVKSLLLGFEVRFS